MPEYRKPYCNTDGELQCQYVEVDPTGRYGRYKEVLGKGASKTVYPLLYIFFMFVLKFKSHDTEYSYRAFDEIEGLEVAWNQVKVQDVLKTPEDLERLYSEVHLLRTLKHKNIIKFYTSWVDIKTQNINFITEMFTSGTLREYRQKHKRVDVRAIKNWARQILRGLLYLHSHDPPIIHRDLKCDNIFVNGNQGEVKIGDLGLAAILRQSHAAHSVIGTPEFMAPELYEEDYNELVDIYAFGMCLLEMHTFEYPYSECSNPAQIYKKVTSGIKPDAFYKVKDPEVRQFVEKCLATVSRRLPARDLLMDTFLQGDDCDSEHSLLRPSGDDEHGLKATENGGGTGHMKHRDQLVTDLSGETNVIYENGDMPCKHHDVTPFSNFPENCLSKNKDFTIKGKKREDDTIFLRVRIADKEGRVRNIYFPFDVESDTAMSVASEMVAELDIADQDVTEIADMIDEEISTLVPDWKAGVALEDCRVGEEGLSSDHFVSKSLQNGFGNVFDHLSTASSESSLLNYLASLNFVSESMPSTREGTVHGRFEEVTYQVNGSDISSFLVEDAPTISSQSSDIQQDADDWANGEDPSSPSSPFSNGSRAGSFPMSDEQSIFSGGSNRQHISRFSKPAEHTTKAGLADYTDETWEEAGPDGLLSDHCGVHRHGLSDEFVPIHHEQDWFRPAYRSQFYPLLPSSEALSDEDEDSVGREIRLLAARHEQELKELQRKHELSLLEETNRLMSGKALRYSPRSPRISPGSNGTYLNQNLKMGLNGWQEPDEDHWSRHSRAPTFGHEGVQVDMVSMEKYTTATTRKKLSGTHSPRLTKDPVVGLEELPICRQATKSSLPQRPIKPNSATNARLTKMHSFGDFHGHQYLNSLAAEVSRLRLYQTVGAYRTDSLNSMQDFSRGMRRAPSVPRMPSPRYHMDRKAQ
eukprot:Gb_00554 [translate_table: standard]